MPKLKLALISVTLAALASTAFAANEAHAATGDKATVVAADPGADAGAGKAKAVKKHFAKRKGKRHARKPT